MKEAGVTTLWLSPLDTRHQEKNEEKHTKYERNLPCRRETYHVGEKLTT